MSVRIDGLVSRTDLNGKTGSLLMHFPLNDRWRVQVGQECARIKTCNLKLVGRMRQTPSKTICSCAGTFELRFSDWAAEMYRADLGHAVQDIKDNLAAGIYVGLDVSYFQENCTDRMCCIFVGDEWHVESERLQRTYGLSMKVFERDKPLPADRFFSIAAGDGTVYAMTSATRVSYYAFIKMQHSNPCALLLPMILTDTLYDADHIVAIYACLSL
jgi:hypothetical protein